MQEWFVVWVGWGDETHIAKVFAPDEDKARVKGFALFNEGASIEDIDLGELRDETVTAIPATDLVIQGG